MFKKTDGNVYLHYVEEIEHKVTKDDNIHKSKIQKVWYLELVKLNGNKIIGRQKIAADLGRVRNVAQGPDGFIYIGVEGKGILKIIPN